MYNVCNIMLCRHSHYQQLTVFFFSKSPGSRCQLFNCCAQIYLLLHRLWTILIIRFKWFYFHLFAASSTDTLLIPWCHISTVWLMPPDLLVSTPCQIHSHEISCQTLNSLMGHEHIETLSTFNTWKHRISLLTSLLFSGYRNIGLFIVNGRWI